MRDNFRIYTAGKMAGLELNEQMAWRTEAELWVRDKAVFAGIPQDKIKFIHPPTFYRYETNYHQSEKEVKDWELNQIRNCDAVIVNLDDVKSSVGTHYELATVDAVNAFGDKHIFVIGVGGANEDLHPWIEETLHRRESNFQDAADYIVNYLLI